MKQSSFIATNEGNTYFSKCYVFQRGRKFVVLRKRHSIARQCWAIPATRSLPLEVTREELAAEIRRVRKDKCIRLKRFRLGSTDEIS
jgi:hypothetical protein